jgi:hypothetical protein
MPLAPKAVAHSFPKSLAERTSSSSHPSRRISCSAATTGDTTRHGDGAGSGGGGGGGKSRSCSAHVRIVPLPVLIPKETWTYLTCQHLP